KGRSVGEASRAEYVDVTVIGPHTGVAIKDRSDARFERLTIARADTAFALYVKKSSFGPSHGAFRDLTVLDTPALAVVDAGCTVDVERGLRLGPDAGSMRPFPGIETSVAPELASLAEDPLPGPGRGGGG